MHQTRNVNLVKSYHFKSFFHNAFCPGFLAGQTALIILASAHVLFRSSLLISANIISSLSFWLFKDATIFTKQMDQELALGWVGDCLANFILGGCRCGLYTIGTDLCRCHGGVFFLPLGRFFSALSNSYKEISIKSLEVGINGTLVVMMFVIKIVSNHEVPFSPVMNLVSLGPCFGQFFEDGQFLFFQGDISHESNYVPVDLPMLLFSIYLE